MPLDRLSKKGMLKSYLSDKTPERGGRHKRIYKLTPEGKTALVLIKKVENAVWEDISLAALEGK